MYERGIRSGGSIQTAGGTHLASLSRVRLARACYPLRPKLQGRVEMNHPRLVRCAVCVLLALLTDKAVGATRGIWISREEIRSLPKSGAAWENVRAAAYGSWGTPKLGLQTVQHGVYVLAGALVYVRSGDTSLRSKVRDGIMGAKRTLDEPLELLLDTGDPNTNPRTLALGRQLGAYVIAA